MIRMVDSGKTTQSILLNTIKDILSRTISAEQGMRTLESTKSVRGDGLHGAKLMLADRTALDGYID